MGSRRKSKENGGGGRAQEPALPLVPPEDEWDGDAWVTKLNAVMGQPWSQSVVDAYEIFLRQYPTAGRQWRQYGEHAVKANQKDLAVSIMRRGVEFASTSIDLWRYYVTFIKDLVNEPTQIIRAFEEALAHIGIDMAARPIWADYIAFIENTPTSNQAEEQAKRDTLRRVYQRAVQAPIHSLEEIWKAYQTFENMSANKELARGLIAQLQPKYYEARAEVRARHNRRDGLLLNTLAAPPRGHTDEEEQAGLWRKYIAGERSNLSGLDPKDLNSRVSYAYEQALAVLYRYPDMWVDAVQYEIDVGNNERVATLLKRALYALPYSELITVFAGDYYELIGRSNVTRALYSESLERAIQRGRMNRTLLFAKYMQFVRRNDGIEAARKVFLDARRAEVGWEAYAEAAWIEVHRNKQHQVAENIFELGMKRFSQCVPFLLQYTDFLWRCNNSEKLGSFFQRVLESLPRKDRSVIDLWQKYIEFETHFGDLDSRVNAQRRMVSVLMGSNDERPSRTSKIGSATKEAKEAAAEEKDLSMYLPSPVDMALKQCTVFDLEPVTEDEKAEILLRRSENVAVARPVQGGALPGGAKSGRGREGGKTAAAVEPEELDFDEALKRMSAAVPASALSKAAPDLEVMLELLRSVPDTLADTPTGQEMIKRGIISSQAAKRKRKSDRDEDDEDGEESEIKKVKKEAPSKIAGENATDREWSSRANAPSIDVFRQRQAVKQSRKPS
ncbi:Cleavage stimulation factor subunit 77 [Porphyridium purpureum]|uniref:Cleavage stimulation factor subunit 77 n=1 Tax=Porphyridium purpureum TaxID=35688 RepID=A0A5J4YMC5_PORPP|nr:Cleavage stimulation factor subunit 77 [Porphyridium purpureum]|eukprot:POR8607..scf244_11